MATGVNFNTLSGVQDIDALLYGSRWNTTSLTYTFPTAGTYYSNPTSVYDAADNIDNVVYAGAFLATTAAMQAAFGFTAKQYSSVSGLRIIKVGSGSAADITLSRTSDHTLGTANARFPTTTHEGDIWFNDSLYNTPKPGNFAWATILHETGHALGLKHGHANDYGLTHQALTVAHDSLEFSQMTYLSYVGQPLGHYENEDFGYPQTLMMYDIAAIQHMYGANFGTNAGGTTYTFSTSTGQMFINGVGQPTPGANRVFLTIWDGNGNDTYNFSNYTTNQQISLAAGGWSLMSTVQRANLSTAHPGHFARGNVFNALQYHGDLRSLIENAVGGSGSDSISGNQVHNVLTGNAGNDKLVGLGGSDLLSGGIGNDVLFGDFLLTGAGAGAGYVSLPAGFANNAFGSALNITSNFALNNDPEITSSTILAHSTVNAVGNGTSGGYYKLTLNAGTLVVADIDHASPGFDSWVQFGNATTLLSENDDSALDPGSTLKSGFPGITQDSQTSFVVPTTGTYFIIVGTYGNIGGDHFTDFIPGGASYELNVSIFAPGSSGTPTNDVLSGGTGGDTMYGGGGNDTYVVDNAADYVIESVAGSSGIDTIQSSISLSLAGTHVLGAVENLTIVGSAISAVGNALANTLTGNALANGLVGGGGNDVLRGFAGNDTLSGGAQNDLFVFNTPLNSATNVDRISDFNVLNDTIVLENAIFTTLGAPGTLAPIYFWKSVAGVAHDSNDHIIYDTDSGNLFYDSNGISAGGAVRFAVLAPNLALTNADFLVM